MQLCPSVLLVLVQALVQPLVASPVQQVLWRCLAALPVPVRVPELAPVRFCRCNLACRCSYVCHPLRLVLRQRQVPPLRPWRRREDQRELLEESSIFAL